jgi:hypothetical protein
MKRLTRALLLVLLVSLVASPAMAVCLDCEEKCWSNFLFDLGCLEFCIRVDAGWEDCQQVGDYCIVQPSQGCDDNLIPV